MTIFIKVAMPCCVNEVLLDNIDLPMIPCSSSFSIITIKIILGLFVQDFPFNNLNISAIIIYPVPCNRYQNSWNALEISHKFLCLLLLSSMECFVTVM